MRQQVTQALIDQMVHAIVKAFEPERVILFGTQAKGEAGPDSDVDLLVVMPVEGDRIEKTLDVRRVLSKYAIPKDIFVTTPEEFAWRKRVPGTIERPADREGRVLYVRR